MHGLVSLLPEPYYHQVEDIWTELESEHGLRGIRVTPYPHFSWQIAAQYPFDALQSAMQAIAADTSPLQVRTTGLGIFTGEQPVLYIQVVRSPEITALHQNIWQAMQHVAHDLSPYYGPDFWMPHISLAYADLDAANIGPVMQRLAFRTYNWQMTIDNIAFIYEPDGQIGALKYKFTFGAGS